MKRIFTCLLFLLAITSASTSQIVFQKTFGGLLEDVGNCVRQTSDHGYIIAGTTQSFGAGGKDMYLIKTNETGDTLWTRTFGGLYDDIATGVQQTNDGGYIVVGSTYSFGSGNQDIYVIRTTANGDTVWTRTYGGTNFESGNGIMQTSDQGFAIVGSTYSYGSGNADVYLIKINGIGDTLWTKTYGGTYDEFGFSIQQIGSGGFVLVGSTNTYGAGSSDVFFIKTDPFGNVVNNADTYGGANNNDYGSSIRQTTDGGFIMVGTTYCFLVDYDDIYLIKTDVNGVIQWNRTIGSTSYETGNEVQQTQDGGYIMIGTTQSFGGSNQKMYLNKVDAVGNMVWSKIFGGSSGNAGNSIAQTADGGYIMVGSTQSFGAGGNDVYLVKTDANGNSGCNNTNVISTTTYPTTTSTTLVPWLSFGATVRRDSTIVSHGGIPNTVCFAWEGIQEINGKKVEMTTYPNPAANSSTVTLKGIDANDKSIDIKIMDLLGNELPIAHIKNSIGTNTIEFLLNTETLANGIYLLQACIGKETIHSKLIIQK